MRDPSDGTVDPEFGPLRPPSRSGCRMEGPCDGSGWVTVGADYAARHYPDPPPLALDATDQQRATFGAVCETRRLQRAAAALAVYPCKGCRPAAFFRHISGCNEQGHEPCDKCATGKRTG